LLLELQLPVCSLGDNLIECLDGGVEPRLVASIHLASTPFYMSERVREERWRSIDRKKVAEQTQLIKVIGDRDARTLR
jgi:hypothetical protein